MTRLVQRTARWLLAAALPRDVRDACLGDIDEEVARRIGAGATRAEAEAQAARHALASLPAAIRLRFECRGPVAASPGRNPAMAVVLQDLRYAARMMRRSPLVSGAAVLTIALGVGATTAIFSVVHAAFVRPLPFADGDRIVRIYETAANGRFVRGVANPANFDFWERNARSVAVLAAMRGDAATLTGAGDPERLPIQRVTPAFFAALGVAPVLGRAIGDHDVGGPAPPVVLSHELWTTRFGADPGILDRTVLLDGVGRPVLGVMPAGFDYPNGSALWTGLELPASERADSTSWFLGVVARLAPDASVEQAQAEFETLSAQLLAAEPARQKGRGAFVVALRDDLAVRVTDGLGLLQGAAAFVLLIAIANIAHLLLTRSLDRRREFVVRSAVGAGRWRLAGQVLTESLLLGLAGAAVGAGLAVIGTRALVALSPRTLPPGMEPTVDLPVLAFALAVALLAALLAGLVPALVAARQGLAAALRADSHTLAGQAGGAGRLRAVFVVAEIALAVTLLTGAGLLIRSVSLLLAQDVGFRPDHVLTAQTMLPAARYDTAEKRGVFWERLFERLAGVPGIEAAGASTAPPFSRWEWQLRVEPLDGTARQITTSIRTVHPGYFEALGIPIVAGRNFARHDRADADRVVLVNQAFARAHLDGRNPLGEQVRLGGTEGPVATIIGVAGDTRHTSLDASAEPEMYRALAQAPPAGLILALRTSADPRSAIAPLRAVLHEIDPDLPLQQVLTMDAMIDRTVAARRFHLALLSTFSAIAVVLAGLGVYSVMAQAVGHRRREIGIRIALGADRADVERLILRAGGTLVACGLALGLAGAMATSGVLRAMLFGVSTRDPLTLGAVLAGFGALGLLAAWAPARRAGRVDPVEVLRPE